MSWIDIAIIALVVLMGTLGVFKGTKKSALALAAFLAAFVIAFLLTNVITELLLSVPVINKRVLFIYVDRTGTCAGCGVVVPRRTFL